MRIPIMPTSSMPGLTSLVPEAKERSSRPDRDHDADDKTISTQPTAPKGLGAIFNAKA